MASIKKYNGSSFENAAIRKYSTASEIITPPTTIYADGSNITTYTIKGNTVQNGTPTPSNPVPVVGVGELETTGEHTGDYKIPILTSEGLVVNYLGSVQSNRQIQKLVLTGEETLSTHVQPPLFIINIPTNYFIPQVTALCTEYKYNPVQSSILANSQHGDFGLQYVNVRDEYNVWFNNSTFATSADFKAYLAQQYANGTPLTVWYVLATPTTAAVNEPLMKIGDYADSISNAVSIPTTEGANTITVDTTVQPSEFTATWTGWHDSTVKEWDGSDWQ